MRNSEQILHALYQIAPRNEIWQTPINGLVLHCADNQAQFAGYVQEPSICVVLQGERTICWGEQCQKFGEQEMMFCPVNLPITSQVAN